MTKAKEAEANPVAAEADPVVEVTMEPIPLFQCHKQVRAFKILSIDDLPDEGDPVDDLILTGKEHSARVDIDYIATKAPEEGGYYVLYEDGYESYSPAKAFEDGYTEISSDEPSSPDGESDSLDIPEFTLLANSHQAEPAIAYLLTLIPDGDLRNQVRAKVSEFQMYRDQNPEAMK